MFRTWKVVACMLLLAGVPIMTGFSQGTGSILSGRVTDADLGEPLAGVTVMVAGSQLGTTTDANGRYELLLGREGTYRIVFSFIGCSDPSKSSHQS